MPSKSKSQQRFFGMVRALQKGEMDPSEASPEIRRAAKKMKKKSVKDFAETKHKGLPERVKKKKKLALESLEEFFSERGIYEYLNSSQFGDLLLDKLQDFGLSWEEADFSLGQIDEYELDQWREDVSNGDLTIEEVAEEVINRSFKKR